MSTYIYILYMLYIYNTYINLHSCKAKHCKANIAKPTVDRFIIYIYRERYQKIMKHVGDIS